MKNEPTIVDIARAAGVSKSTVSLALRNNPICATATRERIQALAKEMGYRQNMAFSVMASRKRRGRDRSNLLGLAYLYDMRGGAPHKPKCLEFQEMAGEHGFFIDGFDLAEVKNPQKFVERLYHRGYCGIVLGEIFEPDCPAYELDLSDFSVVCYSNYFLEEKYHRVRDDSAQKIRRGWERMMQAGYRRIGVACCQHREPPLPDDRIRLGATLECQLQVPEEERIPLYLGRVDDSSSFLVWCRKYEPEALIGFQVGHFYQVRDFLGWRIPEEHGLLCLIKHDEQQHRFISGFLSADEQVWFNIFSLMDQLIRNRMRGMAEHPTTVLVEPEWQEGETIKTDCRKKVFTS